MGLFDIIDDELTLYTVREIETMIARMLAEITDRGAGGGYLRVSAPLPVEVVSDESGEYVKGQATIGGLIFDTRYYRPA